MSSDVQIHTIEPSKSPQKRKSNDANDSNEPVHKKHTKEFIDLKKSIIKHEFTSLNRLNTQIELNLLEKYFLENKLVFIDFPKWFEVHSKIPRNKILRDYLVSQFNPIELTTHLPETCQNRLDLKLPQNNHVQTSNLEQFKSIAERAKHEAQILQKISQLRKDGLWSIKRLPKLVEPQRVKTHWDYLLDEMVWMSTDFVQERKWKVNTCRKIAVSIQKYFKEKEIKLEQMEKEEEKRKRKQASLIGREVQNFWKQVEKIIEYKHKSINEEKRKIEMDKHLNFIVGQTEKYSSWLMESLNKSKEEKSENESDESMIESDEEKPVDNELEKLKMESELDLNDLLKDYNLDESYFCQQFKQLEEKKNEDEDKENEVDETDDDEDIISDDMSDEEDDEETIEHDEKVMANDYDADKELAELRADFELPIEELLEKLKQPPKSDETAEPSNPDDPKPENRLDSIAAQAESFQPTGYTLETTHVKTRIPTELLKHNLREYQHVGLDWLVTMYDNKLNGILADEMGLGKTIQTISLLAHLAVDKGIWGPHLIVVPTSVMLNWELEFKKWCPGFKILTYYGSQKERKQKRIGWTKNNAFHVCITSYKLVIQDHAIFRRKKWKYFILDEAQNIKNFKSQRWQSLLNFQSQRRLLLTGTPLQNNLMELWSLMHFLMPHVFSSHREFQHWFNNPLKSMIEKSQEVNEQLIKRLHKVLRPFILRRLKSDVEKQMPKKYEHIVKCPLSKRQRLLYDEFMSLSSTREKLAEGRYMSVINILMQLRKVCNHPDLFEPRPIVSPFVTEAIQYEIPFLVFNLDLNNDNVYHYQPSMCDLERLCAFDCHRAKRLQTPRKLIEEILTHKPEEEGQSEQNPDFFLDHKLSGLTSDCIPIQRVTDPDPKIKVNYLTRLNKLRCLFHKPMYGRDLLEFLSNKKVSKSDLLESLMNVTSTLMTEYMVDLIERFVFYVPNVRYSSNEFINLRIPSPDSSLYEKHRGIRRPLIQEIKSIETVSELSQKVTCLQSTQFPEKRLIQYDCGKLQCLDKLLRDLYSGEHRVLVFTQMTRMLDVLENFLNYHGYKYLRLDGATSIEQRQVLMERFNTDKRIFCFILSTRSGGVGVNLTGADTVVFYDSDWNPTMDAQAQDRCHRIGQTRDVHIYRLISEKTVEENILKKADQKRLLSQMAIEGGCFTTAVLRKSHITELFDEHDENQQEVEPMVIETPKEVDSNFEEALGMVEDESDVQAAKVLREEVRADIAEFDENEQQSSNDPELDLSKLETEFKIIEKELKPIERYALKFLESTGEVAINLETDNTVEIEQSKKKWELNRLKQLKEEEERKAEQEEDELMFTYTKSEIWVNDYSEQMTLWCPLTPPTFDSDIYIDSYDTGLNSLYDTEPIPDELLPPIAYTKRGDKRLKVDSISSLSPSKQKQNSQNILTTNQQISTQGTVPLPGQNLLAVTKSSIKSMENIIIPKPLFDKTNTALIKLRRDIKMQKLKGWPTFKMEIIKSTLPIQPEYSFGKDDWLPNDDFSILYTLQVILELPLNLQTIAPSHQPNWDLVSDLVSSSCSKHYRSPLECKKRFENVILKREELCLTEIQNKKQQQLALQQDQSGNKLKNPNKTPVLNITKTKTLRTNQLYLQDNLKQLVQNEKRRFDKITQISKKRHQTQFSLYAANQPAQFTAYSLTQPLTPVQQANHQILLNRFSSTQQQPQQITSNFIMNAMNAVATACKQSQQNLNITPESIVFKTPKYFSDLKTLKEKQAKQASLVVSSPPVQTAPSVPASPTPTQTPKPPQTPPVAQKTPNQTILNHLQQQQQQQQQRATSALAAQLAASAAAVAQQSQDKPKPVTTVQTPSVQTVQQHLQQKPQSISAIIQNQQNQVFFQNQNSNLRSLVQSGTPAATTAATPPATQSQITIAVPISSTSTGPQTISSIINNQQLQQQQQTMTPQQSIRFYANQTKSNTTLNELRKKTTVAGITAAAAAAAANSQSPQSPNQASAQTKQLIQQQKLNKQQLTTQVQQKTQPQSTGQNVVKTVQSTPQQQVVVNQQPAQNVQRPNTTSILIRQNPQAPTSVQKPTVQQTIQQIQQQQTVQVVKPEVKDEQVKVNTQPVQTQQTVQNAQNTNSPQVITVQQSSNVSNPSTVQNIVNRPQTTTSVTQGQPSTITTLIKPVTLSLPNQQKQSIITTNQPQQFRQFQLMTNPSGQTNIQSSQSGQVLIQQPQVNPTTGQPQTTIRKVGSSTNISTLQQKVQVIKRGGIQILQANPAQNVTKTTPINQTSSTPTTSQSNPTPVQFQQVFQQQAALKQTQNQNQSTTSISIQGLSSGSSLSSLMTGPSQKVSSSAPTTVKTLLAGSSQAQNISIITTSAGVNSSGIPQAIPINSSLSQVLRQLSGNQSNVINIQQINTPVISAPVQLIQATPSSSSTSLNEQSEVNNGSDGGVIVVGSTSDTSNEQNSQNEKL